MIDTPEGPIPEPPMEDLVNAPRRAPSSPEAEAAPVGRTPPHSIEAEQGILGCLMLDAASGLDFCLERIREPRQRLKSRSNVSASDDTSSVFAKPGTPTSNEWLRVKMLMST